MTTLKYCKVREVKSPCRAHPQDAGIDFYVPTDLTTEAMAPKIETTGDKIDMEVEDGKIKTFILKPGQSVLIPSGIHVKLQPGYALIFMNKSGVASKRHLHVGASVVDENYQGECHINLANVGTSNVKIEAGDKIVQGLVIPVNYCQTEDLKTIEMLYSDGISDRGSGGFGSSGSK